MSLIRRLRGRQGTHGELLFISNIIALWSEYIVCGYRSLGHLWKRLGKASKNDSTTGHRTWDQLNSKHLNQVLPPFRESPLNSWKEAGYLQDDITILGCNPLPLKMWREREWESKGLRAASHPSYTCSHQILNLRDSWSILDILSTSPTFPFPHTPTWHLGCSG